MIVRQAANVLALLEYFARVRKPSNLAEISTEMGWPRSSTFNLLTTLSQRGFLYEPRPRGGYYPSPRWKALLRQISENDLLPEGLCRAADEMAERTGETVAIAAPSGTKAVFLYVVQSSAAVRFSAEVGYQLPIHATSSGRALLSQYSPSERLTVLRKSKFLKYARGSLLSARQVEAELERAAARGWHENIEGHGSDLTGVAMSAGLPDRRLSIVVGGPTSRMRARIPQIAALLRRTLNQHLPDPGRKRPG
jgi:IclR family transcriptional regulator, acetate operon repressor